LHLQHGSTSDAPYSSSANSSIEWQFDNRTSAASTTARNAKASTISAIAAAAKKQSTSTKQGAAVATVATAGDAHNSCKATNYAHSNESDEPLTRSTSESSSHDSEHIATSTIVMEANAADNVTTNDTQNEHDSSAVAAAAEPEATSEHSSTEHAIQQQCNSVEETCATAADGSSNKAAIGSTVATFDTSSVSAAAAETSEAPVAVFCSGTLAVSTITGHNLHAAIPDTTAAASDTNDDVETAKTAAVAQLYLTIELGEQEQSTSDVTITLATTYDTTASTVVWPDSSIAFTVGKAAELLQGLTVELWDDSGSTLAKGTVAALTLQSLCCKSSSNDTSAVADTSLLDVVIVMQAPASKPRLATATAAATATAIAASSEQLLTQMSVSCCLRYTAGAVATATSASKAVVVETEAQDADMQDLMFDTARSGSADDSASSNHSAESFEEDEPEVNASVCIQDDTAAAIDNSGNSHPQQNISVAVSDANSSNGVEDEELYMSQMADDDADHTEQ
jgi:hypothetical protein